MKSFGEHSQETGLYNRLTSLRLSFSQFLQIARGRNAIFPDFCKLAMAESIFLSFSANRLWPKACFYHFLRIGHGRKHVFIIFCELATAESVFLSFSANWPRPKACFYHFLRIGHGRRVKNIKNGVSATAETEKTLKIGFPPQRMSKKQQKQRFRHG